MTSTRCDTEGRSRSVGVDLTAAWDFILDRTRANAAAFGDRLPHATVDGRYVFLEDGGWAGGFWNGILNLAYAATGDASFLERQRSSWPRYLRRLAHPDSPDNDLGHFFVPSFVADYILTGSDRARDTALQAAVLQSRSFHARGGFLQSWNVWTPGEAFSEENRGRVIIDAMYNLPLLFWAHAQTGEEHYKTVALTHARTSAQYLVRPDGTTFHTYVFDPESGQPKYGRTHQGCADDSCWSRGQAWAIGGFALAHKFCPDPVFLRAARLCADTFIRHTLPGGVVRWDFALADDGTEPIDTSASAIAANGLLLLAPQVDAGAAAAYRRQAAFMAESLFTNHSTRGDPRHQGLLRHGCSHKPANRHVDASLIYGDYFFVELIARLSGHAVAWW